MNVIGTEIAPLGMGCWPIGGPMAGLSSRVPWVGCGANPIAIFQYQAPERSARSKELRELSLLVLCPCLS